MKISSIAAACLAALATATTAWADAPQYSIIDLGVVSGTTSSQGFGISPDGGTAVGRTLGGTVSPAYSWTAQGGMVALPNLSGRNFAAANDVNASGLVVGTSTTTVFGSGALPVMWQNGSLVALPMDGQTVGRAEAVNASGLVAGSVGGGVSQRGALFTASSMTMITATTANGTFMNTAFGINDAGLVVGTGIDPNNAALTVGLLYNANTGVMTNLGALPGLNAAIPFDISESGYVVGSSMVNSGPGSAFIWSAAGGMVAVPLPGGATQGSLRGVNDAGWAVGTASTAFALPFLYDGTASYLLQSLLPAGSGWDLSTNTSSAAYAITNGGSIVGTGVINGQVHAYLMQPVPEPTSWALMAAGLAFTAGLMRRRRAANQ